MPQYHLVLEVGALPAALDRNVMTLAQIETGVGAYRRVATEAVTGLGHEEAEEDGPLKQL